MSDSWVGSPHFEVPDGIEPLEGFRSWSARVFGSADDPGDHFLTSVLQPVWWPVHEPLRARHVSGYDSMLLAVPGGTQPAIHWEQAAPLHKPEQCPDWACHCGVYAWKEQRSLVELDKWVPGRRRVTGRVEMWGHIIVHEHGYRAQFAKVTGIFGDDGSENGLAYTLASRYNVPVLG